MVKPLLILASASPRRLDLLNQIGISPDRVLPANIDETAKTSELPRQLALRLAIGKASATFDAISEDNAVILAADTVVGLGRRILDKPLDEHAAREHLIKLSGRRHRIYGGIAIVGSDGQIRSRVVTTIVRFKQLSQSEIEIYLASEEWQGKAGGYAIQGQAARFVPWINGSYSNVVGLSLSDVSGMLTSVGYP